MSGSINFRRGWYVKVHLTYKNSDASFKPQLIMITFKENYHFPRFQMSGGWGGGGGGGCTFPTETTCDFPGGPDPILYLEVNIFF